MDHETAMRILEVQEKFRNSPEFEPLWAEHQILAEQFKQVMERISDEDTEIIMDFFGVINEIHLRTLMFSVLLRG
jgi:hypothetical protein